jgi:tripartite-type tricarboxylate transporter receptor subunit TctC
MTPQKRTLCFALTFALLLPHLGTAVGQVPFYQGKTITIIQSRAPGGTGDGYVRSMAPFLEKYIPGNPRIAIEYMPGAGGRTQANHMYAIAKPDGLTIGSGSGGIITNGILDTVGVRYDLDKFIYLGSPRSDTQQIFATRRDAGLNTLEKLRNQAGIRIGDQSVGFTTYVDGRLFAYLIGLKEPKFIVGYSGREVDVAFVQGEIDARATPIHNVLTRNKDWIEKKLADFHAVIEVPKGDKHPQFPHLPDIETFAKSEREHKLLRMHRAFRLVGAPFFLPPGTAPDRVQILREAMRRTFNDPEFHVSYKNLVGNEAAPLTGEMQEKALKELPRDPDVVELMKKITGADPLPPR